MKNYYEILGIPLNATNEEIKRAYKQWALKTHPDKIEGKEDEFKEISEAYECLKDSELRKKYDQNIGLIKTLRKENNKYDEWQKWSVKRYNFSFNSSGVSEKTWEKYTINLPWNHSENRWYTESFLSFKKNIVATFKPYKSNYYVRKDAMQALYSVLHIAISIIFGLSILAWPFIALFGVFMKWLKGDKWSYDKLILVPLYDEMISPKYLIKAFIAGSGYLLWGLTEFISFIPNYLLRMPFRWLITPNREPNIGVSVGVQRVVEEFENALKEENVEGLYVTYIVLERKFNKANDQGISKKILEDANNIRAREAAELLMIHEKTLFVEEPPLSDSFKQTLSTYISFFKLKSDTADVDKQNASCFEI